MAAAAQQLPELTGPSPILAGVAGFWLGLVFRAWFSLFGLRVILVLTLAVLVGANLLMWWPFHETRKPPVGSTVGLVVGILLQQFLVPGL